MPTTLVAFSVGVNWHSIEDRVLRAALDADLQKKP
jgi:hypothetical protein